MRQPIASKLAELRAVVERIEATPRKGFTPAQRQAVSDAQHGQCEACEASLSGGFEIDHAVTIWEGGEHAPGNWIGLCRSCHKIKTARDAARRASVKRIIKRETEGQPVSRLQGRGFDKSLRKKMNGKVVRV